MAKCINIYIHDDNAANLSNEKSQSKLINDLLREHFAKIDPAQMNFKQLRRLKMENEFKKEANIKWAELQTKLEELEK